MKRLPIILRSGCSCTGFLSIIAVMMFCASLSVVYAQSPNTSATTTIRFLSSPVTLAVAGESYQYQARAIAAASSEIVYQLTAAPDGMTIDTTSGLISWNPQQEQIVRVAVQAFVRSNPRVSQIQSYSLTVLPQSARQAMVRFLTMPPTEALVGFAFVYSARAYYGVDARITPPSREQQIIYSLENAPSGMIIDAASGAVRWTPANVGTVRFRIRAVATNVADPAVNTATQDVEIQARQAMPQFLSVPPREAFVGFEFVYHAFAFLPDFQQRIITGANVSIPAGTAAIIYSLETAPEGMTIDSNTGIVRWTPTTPVESVRVLIRARVAASPEQTATQGFILTVTHPRAVFITQPPTTAVVGQRYAYQSVAVIGSNTTIISVAPIPTPQPSTNANVQGRDTVIIPPTRPGTAGLVYSLDTAPDGMTIDRATGLIFWTPTQEGSVRVVVRATLASNSNITGTQSYELRVVLPQRITPPVVTPAPPTPPLPTAEQSCAMIRGEVVYGNSTASVQGGVVRAVTAVQDSVPNRGVIVVERTVAAAALHNGQYRLALPKGSYFLVISGGDFGEVWWGNGIVPATSLQTATPITVNCGDTLVYNFTVMQQRRPSAVPVPNQPPTTRPVTTATISPAEGNAETMEADGAAAPSSKDGNTLTSVHNQAVAIQTLQISPNPVSSLVRIHLPNFSGEGQLEIVSLRGDVLFRSVISSASAGAGNAIIPIDVANFANGNYIVRFYASEVRAISQMVISR